MVSNAFSSFFRANSVFYDPSIFGRYLAVTITLVFAALLFGTVRRPLLAAVAAGLAWVGILTSYSQSAFVALCAAVGTGLVLAFGRRLAVAAAASARCSSASGSLAVPSVRHSGVDRVTSERSQLVGDGLRLFRAHPLAGVGLGGSTEAAREQTDARARRAPRAARDAADRGLRARHRRARARGLAADRPRAPGARSRAPAGPSASRSASALLAIFVHSLFYAAFFEDPLTWGLAALLVACAAPGIIEEP